MQATYSETLETLSFVCFSNPTDACTIINVDLEDGPEVLCANCSGGTFILSDDSETDVSWEIEPQLVNGATGGPYVEPGGVEQDYTITVKANALESCQDSRTFAVRIPDSYGLHQSPPDNIVQPFTPVGFYVMASNYLGSDLWAPIGCIIRPDWTTSGGTEGVTDSQVFTWVAPQSHNCLYTITATFCGGEKTAYVTVVWPALVQILDDLQSQIDVLAAEISDIEIEIEVLDLIIANLNGAIVEAQQEVADLNSELAPLKSCYDEWNDIFNLLGLINDASGAPDFIDAVKAAVGGSWTALALLYGESVLEDILTQWYFDAIGWTELEADVEDLEQQIEDINLDIASLFDEIAAREAEKTGLLIDKAQKEVEKVNIEQQKADLETEYVCEN